MAPEACVFRLETNLFSLKGYLYCIMFCFVCQTIEAITKLACKATCVFAQWSGKIWLCFGTQIGSLLPEAWQRVLDACTKLNAATRPAQVLGHCSQHSSDSWTYRDCNEELPIPHGVSILRKLTGQLRSKSCPVPG